MPSNNYTFCIFFACLVLYHTGIAQEIIPGDQLLITPPTWLNSSSEQFDKFIQDKYNYFITTQGNKVWVASMNLAWNELKRNFLQGQNATFKNLTYLQQHMIDNLNSQIFTKDNLSEDAYYVYSGYGQQSITKINFDVKQKFPLRTLPDLDYQMNDQDFISYAYLFKNFKFPVPFAHLPTFSFKGVTTPGFHAMGTKQKKQVYYKYYNSSNDFMIGIQTSNNNDEIILWKTDIQGVNTEFTLQKVMKMFDMLYNLPSQRLATIDQFRMPVVNLEMNRSYKDLLGLKFSDDLHSNYIINKMDQKIRLKVTRFGVELQAQGAVQIFLTSSRFAKYFYLNSNFWVFLKQKNKLPYLVTLVTKPNQIWSQ